MWVFQAEVWSGRRGRHRPQLHVVELGGSTVSPGKTWVCEFLQRQRVWLPVQLGPALLFPAGPFRGQIPGSRVPLTRGPDVLFSAYFFLKAIRTL